MKSAYETYYNESDAGARTRFLDVCEIIDARGIAVDYLSQQEVKGDKIYFRFDLDEIMHFVMAPPFGKAWIESYSMLKGTLGQMGKSPSGFMVTAEKVDKFLADYDRDTALIGVHCQRLVDAYPDLLARTAELMHVRSDTRRRIAMLVNKSPDARWLIEIMALDLMDSTDYMSPETILLETNSTRMTAFMILSVGSNGEWIDSIDWLSPYVLGCMEGSKDEIPRSVIDDMCIALCIPALGCLNLLNCKNVTLEAVPVPEAVARKRRKRGKPVIEWKRLVVDIGRNRRRYIYENRPQHDDPQRAFHVCRGHFRTYTADAPLFGKYTGRYWIPQHTRGSETLGTIHKVYEPKIKAHD